MKTVVCDICGAEGAKIRKVARLFGKGANMLVVQNVPAAHCPTCGETYFTSDTLRTLDEVRKKGRANATPREIPVADF